MWDIWCFQGFWYILLWRSFWGFLSECFPCHFIWLCFLLCSVPQNLVVINGSNWEEAKRTQAFDQSVRCLAACLLACRLISSISKVASLLCFPILDNRIHEAFCPNILLLKLHFVTSWTRIQNVSCRCSIQACKVAKWACPTHLLRLLPPPILLPILPSPPYCSSYCPYCSDCSVAARLDDRTNWPSIGTSHLAFANRVETWPIPGQGPGGKVKVNHFLPWNQCHIHQDQNHHTS